MPITPKLSPISPDRPNAPGREEPLDIKEFFPTIHLTKKEFPILQIKEAGDEFIIIARVSIKNKHENDDGEIEAELEFTAINAMEDALSIEEQREVDDKIRSGDLKLL